MLLQVARAAAHSDMRVAIIVNEAGEVGIDGKKIQSEGYDAVELTEGCICCSLSGTLQNTLIQVNRDFQPDIIILEPTGLALPHRVEKIIRNSMIHPDRVLTVGIVDAFRLHGLLEKRQDFLTKQLGSADFIILNKCDLLNEEETDERITITSQICPGKDVLPVSAQTGEGMDDVIRRIVS